MSMRLLLLLFCISSLLACTSARVGRAPVTDLMLAGQNGFSRGAAYVAPKGKITKKFYGVQKGDTLYSIGWRSGTSVSSLIAYNNLKKPFIIQVGKILRLTPYKPISVKKSTRKSGSSKQNPQKNTNIVCSTQNCKKNNKNKLAQQKTKVYSKQVNDKKIAKNNKENKTNNNNKNNKNNKNVGNWSWPVNGKITKKFSVSASALQGISIVSKRGSLIRATYSGQVVYAGSGLRGYGNLIIIKHNYDYLSAYAHNETLLVRENEWIKKGQKIATMGDTGSDHVHLHFEIRYRGKSVDPLRYLPKK